MSEDGMPRIINVSAPGRVVGRVVDRTTGEARLLVTFEPEHAEKPEHYPEYPIVLFAVEEAHGRPTPP
jgi:hypothetical protein